MVSGWIVAALCLHVVRTPDPRNPEKSVLVVIPKDRLRLSETYVDARQWTMSDVPAHRGLVMRMIYADKAGQLQFLADPNNREDIEAQLTDVLANARSDEDRHASTAKSSTRANGFRWGSSNQHAENPRKTDSAQDASWFSDLPDVTGWLKDRVSFSF